MKAIRLPLICVGVIVAVMALAFVLTPRSAEAHALLIDSDPPQNGQLTAAPSIITTFYSETLDTNLSSLQVLYGTGERVDDGGTQFDALDPTKMTIAVKDDIGPGYYQVVWETLSAIDGHLFKGSFPFTVLNPDGTQPSGPKPCEADPSFCAAGGTTAKPLTVSVRWARIIFASALIGALAFAAWVVSPSLGEVNEPWRSRWREAARKRLLWVALPAAALLALNSFGELYNQADQLGGTQFLDDVLRTDWGTRWIQREIVLAGMVVALSAGIAFAGRARWVLNAATWIALGGGLVYLLLIALTTHADTIPGSFFAVIADFLHLLAAAVWLGMLFQLLLFLLWLRQDIPDADKTALQAGHLQRFSTIAASSVTVLLATGVANAASQIPDISALIDTAYGRALLVKMAILGALLIAAGLNAFYLRPRIVEESEDGLPTDDLRRRMLLAVRVELLLGLAVMCAAAILVLYPTSRQIRDVEAAQNTGPRAVIGEEIQQPAGDLVIDLTVSPNTTGLNAFRVFLFPGSDSDIGEVLRVRMRFHYRGEDLGQAEVVMEPAGTLAYRAAGPFLSRDGNWDIDVDVRRRGVDDVSATFPLGVEAPGGGHGKYELPLTVGTWGTVIAGLVVVLALLVGIWTTEWPNFPQPEPRLLRVGTAAVSVIGIGVLVLTLLPRAEKAQGNPIKSSEESITIGRMIYEQNCQQCHGADGRGDGPIADTLPVRPADFRQHIPYHQDEFFFNVITNGLGTIMPSFQTRLSEDQRWHLINFLHSEFGTDDAQSTTPTPAPSN